MYLSRLILNPSHRQVQRELADAYQRHRTIMSAFPEQLPEDERVLHRLEVHPRTGAVTLLVQSRHAPNWRGLIEKPRYLLEPPQVKHFTPQFSEGQLLRFRLQANPTIKLKRETRKHGNRVPLKREEEQLAWLARKGQIHGFQLPTTPDGLPLVRVARLGEQHGRIHRQDHHHRLTLYVVQFDGILRVTDPEQFGRAVIHGIGPAKSFGCGLLSLAPA